MTEPTRPCGTCGMPCTPGEYHPYAACLMFKACHNSETVRANLEAVRATSQPTQAQAGAVPLTDEQITAAAKKLAECMEYPWEFMPEPGRENMRKHAQAVIAAANGIKGGQHGAE